MSYMIYRTTPP